jgi:uncharacterized delta-60 repeat protein
MRPTARPIELLEPRVLLSTSPQTVSAAASLDTSFGNDGILYVYVSSPDANDATTAVLERDGSVLYPVEESGGVPSETLTLLHILPDGTFDQNLYHPITFLTGNIVTGACAEESDGKIVVVGGTYDAASGGYAPFVMRLNQDGSSDKTFGEGGIAASSGLGSDAVAIEPDGGILVGENSSNGLGHVVRLNPDGSLDTAFSEVTFNPNNITTATFGSQYIVTLADGQFLLYGDVPSATSSSPTGFIARYNANGKIDSGFGQGGAVYGNFSARSDAVQIASDGSIYALDSSSLGNFSLTKLTPNGDPDSTFGTNGTATIAFPETDFNARCFALNPNGDFEVGGTIGTPFEGEDGGYLVGQLTANFTWDDSFTSTGCEVIAPGHPENYVDNIFVDAAGHIVLTGGSQNQEENDEGELAVVRLNGTALAPTITANPTDQSTTVGQSATFSAAASGAPTPTVQWYVETPGNSVFTSVPGATSTTLTISSTTTDQSGSQYEAIFTSSEGSATTTPATLTVAPASSGGSSASAPVVTVNPVSQTVTDGEFVTLTAAASNVAPYGSVVWSVETPQSSAFTKLQFTGTSSGGDATLVVGPIDSGDYGNQYEAVFSNSAGKTATSAAATLSLLTVIPPSTPQPPYTHQQIAGIYRGTLNGTLGGVPFSNQPITLTIHAVVENVYTPYGTFSLRLTKAKWKQLRKGQLNFSATGPASAIGQSTLQLAGKLSRNLTYARGTLSGVIPTDILTGTFDLIKETGSD